MNAMIAGRILLGLAVLMLLWTARLDRKLLVHRRPDTPRAAYLGQVGRWHRNHYTADAHPLLVRTRWAFGLFCLLALLGGLVLEAAR